MQASSNFVGISAEGGFSTSLKFVDAKVPKGWGSLYFTAALAVDHADGQKIGAHHWSLILPVSEQIFKSAIFFYFLDKVLIGGLVTSY